MSMFGLVFFVVIFFSFIYGIGIIGSVVKEPAKQSVSAYQRVITKPDAIRSEYGAYGERFASKDTFGKEPPSGAEQSLMELPKKYQHTDEYQSQLTGFTSNPQNPGSPFGIHGNNQSAYDINSPSGAFKKF